MTVFQFEQVKLAVWARVRATHRLKVSVPADLGQLGERGWNQVWELRVAVGRAMDQNLIRGQANDDIRSRR